MKGRRNEWKLSVCHHWCWENVPRCQKVSAQILIEAWLTIRLELLVFAPKKLLRAISVKSTLHIPLTGWWSPTPKKWQREMKDFKIDSLFKTWICVVVALSPFQHIALYNNLCEGHLYSINRFLKTILLNLKNMTMPKCSDWGNLAPCIQTCKIGGPGIRGRSYIWAKRFF